MAIDSAEKRRSILALGSIPLNPGVTPNVGKDAEWRAQMLANYSGIAAGAPPEPGMGGARKDGWIRIMMGQMRPC